MVVEVPIGDHTQRGKPGGCWETTKLREAIRIRQPYMNSGVGELPQVIGWGWDEACIQIQTKGKCLKTTLQLI